MQKPTKKKTRMKVTIADHFKREAVLINKDGDMLAEGENSRQIIKKVYGR